MGSEMFAYKEISFLVLYIIIFFLFEIIDFQYAHIIS